MRSAKLELFGYFNYVKDNVRINEHRMFTSAIKKQTSNCCSISLNPYYGISNLVMSVYKKTII